MKSDGDLASTDKISSDIFQSSVVVSCCHGTQESALQPCSSPQLYDQGVVGKQKSHTVYSWLKYTKLVSLPVIIYPGISVALHTAAAIFTALCVCQSDGITRLPKWSPTTVWLGEEKNPNEE